MINLISTSPTRAKILAENGIKFNQVAFDFDESVVLKNTTPTKYVLNVVKAKKEQFLAAQKELTNLLFADSCVVCDGEILGKAVSKEHARAMLNKQSDNFASVVTAMIFLSPKFELIATSTTTYKFAKFAQNEIERYLESGEYIGKAGAMMVEGFNKNYILSQTGTTNNARGLNLELLRAFL